MGNMKPSVYVVIPVFQRLKTTQSCLQFLQKQTYPNIQVIVSDGGSKDGSPEAISKEFPQIVVLRTDQDLWWSGAMHAGIEKALSLAAPEDLILFMNDDTKFDETYVEKLVHSSQRFDASVGALTLDWAHPEKVLDAGEFMDWKNYDFPVRFMIPPGETFCDEVDFLPGRGSIVPVKVFAKVGNINQVRYPHYIADYDFFARVKEAGFKLVIDYGIRIYSDTAATGIFDQGKPHITWKQYKAWYFSIRSMNRYRDHFRFITDHAPAEYKRKHQLMLTLRVLKRGLHVIPYFYETYCWVKRTYSGFKTATKRLIFLISPPQTITKDTLDKSGIDCGKFLQRGLLRDVGGAYALSISCKWKRFYSQEVSDISKLAKLNPAPKKLDSAALKTLTK